MEDVEVPDYFLCPISMQLMRDPVTTSTGITYDRENIEKWLFKCKNTTCPITKQELLTMDLTPNHTLRRVIQSWCIMNSSHGVERIPTPKSQVTKSYVLKLLKQAMQSQEMQLSCLRKLKSIVHAMARHPLQKVVPSDIVSPKDSESYKLSCDNSQTPLVLEYFITKASDEALDILFHLNPSDETLKKFVSKDNGDELFLDSLLYFLKCGNYQSQDYAIMLLKSAFNVADPGQLIGAKQEYFKEILLFLNNKLISQQATKASLKLLVQLCPWGRNRIKAIEVGAISTLIELLLDIIERRSSTSRVLQEMLQVGVVSKLCLVIQVGSCSKTKEKAKEIL
ncbi:hypothetical protein H5410_064970, partial [Solanum commersonii]